MSAYQNGSPGKGSLASPNRGAVEDYTKPFLVTFAAWVFCALTLIWAVWGFLLAILLSVAANHMINVGAARKAARGALTRSTTPLPPR